MRMIRIPNGDIFTQRLRTWIHVGLSPYVSATNIPNGNVLPPLSFLNLRGNRSLTSLPEVLFLDPAD